MKTVRLNNEQEKELKQYADIAGKTESDIIREALVMYMSEKKKQQAPYDLGKDLFGKVGSGITDTSTTYKTRIKEKIHAKNTR